ncbi:MAG: cytochrome P450 [Sporichthyaceae bacterium]
MTTAEQIDILGPEAIRDPSRYFSRLREEGYPVFWDARYRSWLITSHAAISEAIKDPRFSSDRIAPFIDAKLAGSDVDPAIRLAFDVLRNWMVFQDDPSHARLRRLVSKAFTPRSIANIEAAVVAKSTELAAALPRRGTFDLIAEFTYPLPVFVIAEMLGVPDGDRAKFKDWAEEIAPVVSGGLDDPARYDRAGAAMAELVEFFTALLAHYAAHPQDNLLTALAQAREGPEPLTQLEVLAFCTLLMFAGHETTANLISSSMLALCRHPDQLELLRSGRVDPAKAVEEFLRWDGPGKSITRVLACDAEFGGHLLKKGQRAFLVLAAANRDPEVFSHPDDLRLDRADCAKHLGFGGGGHFCMGASLARLETRIALPILLRALPDVRLSAHHSLEWQQVLLTRGLKALWLTTGPGAE